MLPAWFKNTFANGAYPCPARPRMWRHSSMPTLWRIASWCLAAWGQSSTAAVAGSLRRSQHAEQYLHSLGLMHADAHTRSAPATWLLNPPAFRRETSQGGQDGALEYIFHHIGTTNKYYVEFGFNNDAHDQGSGSNTYHLKHQYGWTGLLMDGDHSNSSINLHREKILPSNIIDLFEKHGVPLDPDFVSIDVDSTDLWILRAILASPYRPRVLTVEYNCVYGALPIAGTHPDDADIPWQGDNIHGASFYAINLVAQEFGWTVALRIDHLDAVLIRNDLIEHVAKPSFQIPECAGHRPAAPERAALVLDYHTWRLTGDATAARAALSEQLKRYGMDFTRPGARAVESSPTQPLV